MQSVLYMDDLLPANITVYAATLSSVEAIKKVAWAQFPKNTGLKISETCLHQLSLSLNFLSVFYLYFSWLLKEIKQLINTKYQDFHGVVLL